MHCLHIICEIFVCHVGKFHSLQRNQVRSKHLCAGRNIFFRITAQDRNIMLLAQFNSCIINIHFVTVYDAIISLL